MYLQLLTSVKIKNTKLYTIREQMDKEMVINCEKIEKERERERKSM